LQQRPNDGDSVLGYVVLNSDFNIQ
jgi:hypothetical protein